MFPRDALFQLAFLSIGSSRLCSAATISRTARNSLNARDTNSLNENHASMNALPAVWEDNLPMASSSSSHMEYFSLLAGMEVSCSKSRPCKVGCCVLDDDGEGKCGSGPSYCGGNCTSGCSWKSQCDPGWGMDYSASSKCPLNACCSQYGFCGATEEFCKDQVKRPSCPRGSKAKKRRIGYYQGWNLSKRPCGNMSPEQIPLGYYSQINFASAYIDPKTSRIVKNDETKSMVRSAQALKSRDPNLSIWISIGGGAMAQVDNNPWKGAFSHMASQESSQEAFLDSLLELMDESGFDGVDLNWEYPTDEETGGKAEDFDNFVVLCRKIRERFEGLGRGGLSITLPTPYKYMKGYNLKALEKHVDWFNFMTYDLHGIWEKDTPDVESQAYAHTNLSEIELKMDMLWRNHIKPSKVILGMAFYGRSFTMSDADCKAAGCAFREAGRPGRCTQSAGVLSVLEILDLAGGNRTVVQMDRKAAVKTMAWGEDQWVGFDDVETLRMKVEYANARCLAGTMVWSIDMDDGSLTEGLASVEA